jgi:hypothetical protein
MLLVQASVCWLDYLSDLLEYRKCQIDIEPSTLGNVGDVLSRILKTHMR